MPVTVKCLASLQAGALPAELHAQTRIQEGRRGTAANRDLKKSENFAVVCVLVPVV